MRSIRDAYEGMIEEAGLRNIAELRLQIDKDKNRRTPSGNIALTASEHLALVNLIEARARSLKLQAEKAKKLKPPPVKRTQGKLF